MDQQESLWRNAVTFAGAIVAFLATVFFITFQLIELLVGGSNPYAGLWSFLILPAVLVFGLILIPAGYLLERRRRRLHRPEAWHLQRLPHFDPNNPRHRRAATIFVLGSFVTVPLIGVASYEGYHYTDSTQFCGQVCHSVMAPEYIAYSNSPHARVTCAACHIGAGADWYVKSKLSGIRQVFAVTFDTFSRPIPTPVENLRPARETCEQCHWPAKFYGAQLRTRVHFMSDEANTRKEVRVLIKTGGADPGTGPPGGIHYHMAINNRIEYVATDTRRQVIPWVRATDPSGRVKVYRSDGKSSQAPPPPGEIRHVDCVDCHNRPTHVFPAPDHSVNVAMYTGRMDPSLPWLKKVSVEALTGSYETRDEANRKIETYIRDFYRNLEPKMADPRRSAVHQAIEETKAIYNRSLFPEMKVDWRTHPDNIGHMIYDGCFRCHDAKHVSDDRESIRTECSVCHDFEQAVPVSAVAQVFRQTTLYHPVKLEGIHGQLKCSSCHTGGRAPRTSCAGCHETQSLFRQGKEPVLPGLQGTTPTVMADLDCDSCHDLQQPQTPAALAAQCAKCHDASYPDML